MSGWWSAWTQWVKGPDSMLYRSITLWSYNNELWKSLSPAIASKQCSHETHRASILTTVVEHGSKKHGECKKPAAFFPFNYIRPTIRWGTLMMLWQVDNGSPTRLVPLMDIIWSPMFSFPDFSAGPACMMFAMITVGRMEPQPDSTITRPSISPFCFSTWTWPGGK